MLKQFTFPNFFNWLSGIFLSFSISLHITFFYGAQKTKLHFNSDHNFSLLKSPKKDFYALQKQTFCKTFHQTCWKFGKTFQFTALLTFFLNISIFSSLKKLSCTNDQTEPEPFDTNWVSHSSRKYNFKTQHEYYWKNFRSLSSFHWFGIPSFGNYCTNWL